MNTSAQIAAKNDQKCDRDIVSNLYNNITFLIMLL